MNFAIFCHSLVSDWNHGNAHFLRGIVAELQAREFGVRVFEPENGWSIENLRRDHGEEPIREFHRRFPHLQSSHEWALDGVDVALVHEWNDPALVAEIGRYRERNPHIRIFFHDTHHRAVTAPEEMARFDLSQFDGVLVYGESLREAYRKLGWGKQVHVWHEAADVRVFRPLDEYLPEGDVVWIGNWGDEERTEELREFLLGPVKRLRLRARAYGVRYPESALEELERAGIEYRGWVANYKAPEVFARFGATVHVPRRPYTRSLPGIPTIRPFEALACAIPLVSAPWEDTENLFRVGKDFLMARDGAEMETQLQNVLHDPALANSLRQHGLETIGARHTCGHRVNELLKIYESVKPAQTEVNA
ncbi:MAG TPA: glycosyltransferase [Bryobacteraceae bacterium]|nr:glycosyltransferase [Bryobacteraceae bacterium]